MTIKKNLDRVIKEFNQGYGGATSSKESLPSKGAEKDEPSKPVKKRKGQRVLRKKNTLQY